MGLIPLVYPKKCHRICKKCDYGAIFLANANDNASLSKKFYLHS
jgi:hypothetical protein